MATKTYQRTETPDYRVIKKLGTIEIREYPELIMASTSLGKSYTLNSGNGFRKVAGYIFGGNERQERISMTSPVMVEMADTMKMSFIMPSKYDLANLPAPDNSQVRLEIQKPGIFAAIRYSGYTSDSKMEEYKQLLISELDKNGISYTGEFIFLGYNPPYRFINRRNEIMVSINLDRNFD